MEQKISWFKKDPKTNTTLFGSVVIVALIIVGGLYAQNLNTTAKENLENQEASAFLSVSKPESLNDIQKEIDGIKVESITEAGNTGNPSNSSGQAN